MSKKPFVPLARIYDPSNHFEMGIDECARGPLFGRLYVAATILPKNEDFKHDEMKDSKKIKSRTQRISNSFTAICVIIFKLLTVKGPVKSLASLLVSFALFMT